MNQPFSRHRTRYVGYVAISVDGRISTTKRTLPAWTSQEDWTFFQRALSRADAIVVGRNTYHAAAARLRQRTTYVLTSRVQTIYRRGTVTFVNPDSTDLRSLLDTHRTVAVAGGGRVYYTMIKARLLQDLFITIEPLILGRGVPTTVGKTTTRLQLRSVQKLNSTGTLLLHYTISDSL